MCSRRSYEPTIVIALALWCTEAAAHEEPGVQAGSNPFLSGLGHPVLGPDHFLAMFSVGLVSAILGGRNFWLVPVAFVATMPFGWLIGRAGVSFPAVEVGIAVSVVALGAGALLAHRLPRWLVYVAVMTVKDDRHLPSNCDQRERHRK